MDRSVWCDTNLPWICTPRKISQPIKMSVVKWHGNFLEKYLKIAIIWNHFTAWRSTRTRLFRPEDWLLLHLCYNEPIFPDWWHQSGHHIIDLVYLRAYINKSVPSSQKYIINILYPFSFLLPCFRKKKTWKIRIYQ